jgi:hypothetical protein
MSVKQAWTAGSRRHVLTCTSVIAISTMLPTTIKASNVFHASQK